MFGFRAGMLVLGAAVGLVAAAPAQGATTYPSGGSGFAAGAEGWAGGGTSCSVGLGSLCSTSTAHDSTAGNPPGSISVRMSVTLNVAGTFVGAATWTSPAFTVTADEAVTGATFGYDRQLDAGDLLNLAPESTVTVDLLDVGAGSTRTLLSEQLTAANAAFARRSVAVPQDAVVAGHTYRLRIATATTTGVLSAGVLGVENTRFDNVRLAVDQASPGVEVRRFRTLAEINSLFRRFNENTEVGRLAGGSLIPRRLCTIVGTRRADRIKGTAGHDVICGMGGNDVIAGGRGIDIIDGGNGNDRLNGGARKDKLIGLRGKDRLNGRTGNDRAGGGAGRDRLNGASGADRLGGGTGGDVLLGGPGRDRINARDRRRDRVDGGRGRDRARVDRAARAGRNALPARRADRVRRVERHS